MQSGSESGEMSGSVTEIINEVIHTVAPSAEGVSHLFVRKAAHFCEFALLGVLFCIALSVTFISKPSENMSLLRLCTVLLSLPCSVAIAAADETIQLFVEGRAGALTDVLIDSSGAACATLIFFAILLLFNAKKTRSE